MVIRPVRPSCYCSERFRLSLLPICGLPTAPTSDLNPVDHKVSGTMQDRVYPAKVWGVDDLKQHLIDVWDSLEQSVIDDATDQWLSRLRAHVHVEGTMDILNSLRNLYLNFVIKWHVFVTTAVECIVLIWKCLCFWQLPFHKVVQQHV